MILRRLWCLTRELVFMLSPNESPGVLRIVCSEGRALQFNVSVSGLSLVGPKRTVRFVSSLCEY